MFYLNISNASQYEHKPNEVSRSFQILETVRIILACSGFILNALTIILLVRIRRSLRPHMRLILCLNVADLLLSVEVIIFYCIPNEPSEFIHCVKFLLKSFETVNVLGVMSTLLVIAGDQCIATIKPMHYHQIVTTKRINICLVSVWLIVIIIVVIGTVLSTVNRSTIHEINTYSCYDIKRQYTFFINAALCVLAFPVFLTLYLVIYKSIRNLRGRDSLRGRKISTKKATQTTMILIFPFIIIYVPVSVYILVVSIFNLNINWPFWNIFMVLLALHTNSDPIICVVRFRELKNGYKAMFYKCASVAVFAHLTSLVSKRKRTQEHGGVQSIGH